LFSCFLVFVAFLAFSILYFFFYILYRIALFSFVRLLSVLYSIFCTLYFVFEMAENANFHFSLSPFSYEGAKMYNFLPLAIKQRDGLKMLEREEIYPEYNTIFLFMLIDTLISLFCCVLHFLHLVLRFVRFYILRFCILHL